jgi:hypothetical protein
MSGGQEERYAASLGSCPYDRACGREKVAVFDIGTLLAQFATTVVVEDEFTEEEKLEQLWTLMGDGMTKAQMRHALLEDWGFPVSTPALRRTKALFKEMAGELDVLLKKGIEDGAFNKL